MNEINPYELLGVTTESSVDAVRKAYRGLALQHHEDKGGTKSSMIAVNAAYAFVLRELRHRDHERASWTPEEIQADFDLLNSQMVGVPDELRFPHGFDPDAFNSAFEALLPEQVVPASERAGYGSVMDPAGAPRDELGPVSHPFDLTPSDVSDEPAELSGSFSQVMELAPTESSGFGAVTDAGLHMTDYKHAFSQQDVLSSYPLPESKPLSADDMAAQVLHLQELRAKTVVARDSTWDTLVRHAKRLVRLQWGARSASP